MTIEFCQVLTKPSSDNRFTFPCFSCFACSWKYLLQGFGRLHSAHARAGAGALLCGAAGGAGGQEGSGLLFR